MPHFYVKPENIKNNTFLIDGEQAHYVATVRRFNAGDEVMLFDGLGNSYKAQISAASKTAISGNIISSSYKMPEFKIVLYTAIPKGDRFEWLIEKAGELGATALIPIVTKRSVQTEISPNKLERFNKISLAASSQCGRNDIMSIKTPVDFKTACKEAAANKNFINILPWESAGSAETITNLKNFQGANIFIGPEGGFEPEEIEFAKSLGFKTITLGENILRTETAAITAVILVNYLS